jgi:hypothetical protein
VASVKTPAICGIAWLDMEASNVCGIPNHSHNPRIKEQY